MSYVNAYDVLPAELVTEIQKFVDGKVIYIPRKDENTLSWGEKSGTRHALAARNREIVSRYCSGVTTAELGAMYYLSEKRIRGILHESESPNRENGGFKK